MSPKSGKDGRNLSQRYVLRENWQSFPNGIKSWWNVATEKSFENETLPKHLQVASKPRGKGTKKSCVRFFKQEFKILSKNNWQFFPERPKAKALKRNKGRCQKRSIFIRNSGWEGIKNPKLFCANTIQCCWFFFKRHFSIIKTYIPHLRIDTLIVYLPWKS